MFLVVILTVLLKRILSEKTGQPQCLGAYVIYSLQLCLLQVWTVKTYTTECIYSHELDSENVCCILHSDKMDSENIHCIVHGHQVGRRLHNSYYVVNKTVFK